MEVSNFLHVASTWNTEAGVNFGLMALASIPQLVSVYLCALLIDLRNDNAYLDDFCE